MDNISNFNSCYYRQWWKIMAWTRNQTKCMTSSRTSDTVPRHQMTLLKINWVLWIINWPMSTTYYLLKKLTIPIPGSSVNQPKKRVFNLKIINKPLWWRGNFTGLVRYLFSVRGRTIMLVCTHPRRNPLLASWVVVLKFLLLYIIHTWVFSGQQIMWVPLLAAI